MRVVVCEDDVTLRSLLSSLLEEGGDEVIAESDNAMEALELTRRFKPDVLLLDHAIRAGTGLEVVASIAADPELILLGDAAYDPTITSASVTARAGWGDMSAVKDGQIVVVLDDVVITRPGPRIVDGLEALAKAIHPELFP